MSDVLYRRFFTIAISALILGHMLFKHWAGAWFLVLFLVSFFCLIARSNQIRQLGVSDFVLVSAFQLPLLSILLAQTLRGDIVARELDAPSRLALVAVLYVALRAVNFRLNKTIFFALLGAIFILPFGIDEGRTNFFGGRIASAHLDVNLLANQLSITFGLTFSIFLLLFSKLEIKIQVFAICSLLVGSFLLVLSESRGGWLTFSAALVSSLILLRKPLKANRSLVFYTLGIFVVVLSTLSLHKGDRVKSILSEPYEYVFNNRTDSSGGERLSLLKLSWELFKEQPIYGYGERNFQNEFAKKISKNLDLQNALGILNTAGPHNEFAFRSLQAGIIGLAGFVCFLAVPILILIRNLKLQSNRDNERSFDAERTGLVFLATISVSLFHLEPFATRSSATFLVVILVTLLADSQNRARQISRQ